MQNYVWQVNYKGDPKHPLSECFRDLRYTQSFNNEIGVAVHKFLLSNRAAGDLGIETAPPEMEGQLIDFEVTDTSSQSQNWKHQIVAFNVGYEEDSGYPATMVTMDLKAKMNLDEHNRAHRFDKSATEPLKELLQEYDLIADLWEDQEPIDEFKILRQINMTDYVWIVNHVIPRLKDAFVIYATEENKINFHSTGYDAGSYTPPPDAVASVYETNNLLRAVSMGGGTYAAYGYNPESKVFIQSEKYGEDIQPSFGSEDPAYLGLRSSPSPYRTAEALNNVAVTRNKQFAYHRYGVSIFMDGHIPDGGWWLPNTFDLSSTKYKDSAPQTGVLHSIEHTVSHSQYHVLARCMKNLKD